MIYRFHRFVWRRLACTNRFSTTLTDRLWPVRLSHSLFGQLVWQMGRAGEGRGGREGREEREGGERGGGGHGVGSSGGRVPRLGPVPGGGQHLAFFFVVSRPSFHMFPILCGFSRSCVGVLGDFI